MVLPVCGLLVADPWVAYHVGGTPAYLADHRAGPDLSPVCRILRRQNLVYEKSEKKCTHFKEKNMHDSSTTLENCWLTSTLLLFIKDKGLELARFCRCLSDEMPTKRLRLIFLEEKKETFEIDDVHG